MPALRTLALAPLALALTATSFANAQNRSPPVIPVLLVTVGPQPPDHPAAAVTGVALDVQAAAVVDTALHDRIHDHFGYVPPTLDVLAQQRADIQTEMAAWQAVASRPASPEALRHLNAVDSAAQLMEQRYDRLDVSEIDRAALRSALLFIAERGVNLEDPARIADAMRRLVRLDPRMLFGPSQASAAVQQAYALAVAQAPQGSLSVVTSPERCVVMRDGQYAGQAPVQLNNLIAGQHRISMTCGAPVSLAHPVEVAGSAVATLTVDLRLDAAMRLEPPVGIHYATQAELDASLARDLVVVGRAIGATRVFAVIPSLEVVRVVDVTDSTLVGEASLRDHTRIHALVTERGLERVAMPDAPAAPPPRAPEASAAPPRAPADTSGHTPVAGWALAGVGVLMVAAGVVCGLESDSFANHAEQNGGFAGDGPLTRSDSQDTSDMLRASEIVGLATGGALILTGVLVGIFGRGHARATPAVSVRNGGAMVGIGLQL